MKVANQISNKVPIKGSRKNGGGKNGIRSRLFLHIER